MAGMFMDHLFHDVLQVKLELLQPMLFSFFLFSEEMLGFQLLYLPLVFEVLISELTKFLTRLHQMRFDL